MAASVLNIGEMIDLAIGTPEMCVVDFCMLQTVLHCLAQQLRVLNKNVELSGAGMTPLGNQATSPSTILVDEIRIEADGVPIGSLEQDTMLRVERISRSDKGTRTPRSLPPSKTPMTPPTKTPPAVPSVEKLSLVTYSKFNLLEKTVEELKEQINSTVPKNEEIIEKVRSQTNTKSMSDVWISLNISSRLDAAEQGIAKLSSLVQDLIAQTSELQSRPIPDPKPLVVSPPHRPPPPPPPSTAEDRPVTIKLMTEFMDHITAQCNDIEKAMKDMKVKHDSELLKIKDSIAKLYQRIGDVPDGTVMDLINALQDQVDHLTKLANNAASADYLKELEARNVKLLEMIHEMQNQIRELYEITAQLAADQEAGKQINADALQEQIELLKTIKLDREDMIEALADKADLRLLARKVSHDQFEMACDDLSKGMEQALVKLNVQESLWQQALDDIQREIESKLDKIELCPVKDNFNKKLKQLQENLKKIISMRRETEAAGTKMKLLKDVNCISCDAPTYMKMEATGSAPPKPLNPTKSMKPYLTYELDAIRKAQANNVPKRDMRDWETIDKQMTTPVEQPRKIRSSSSKHLCNRYCGGSHTTTTPAQRVARMGHFVKQWGLEAFPIPSKFATGDDGRLYKLCETETASVGPGGAVDVLYPPKTPAKKVERKTTPTNYNADCRCLDDALNTKN